MVDESLYSAGFLKEKKEDIDFLHGIDYKALQKKADKAVASGSAQQIHEAVAEIDSYDSRINKKRSTVPVPHLDQAIQACVDKYNEVQASLREGIEGYLQNTKTSFNKEYNAKSPKIARLRSISEDYSTFENKVPGLDDLIIQYSCFSKALRSVETEISGTVEEYKNITTKKQLQAVEQRIRQSGKKIEKIKSNAPKKGIFGLGGIHKAYDYRNDTLARLSLETIRFEKEGFVKKRQQAKKEIDEASDFTDYIQCANDEEIFTIFEEYVKLSFSDISAFAGTIYFGALPKEHVIAIRKVREIAKERAISFQEKFKKKLHLHTLCYITDNQSTTDLKEQERVLREDYGEMVDILCEITGDRTLRKDLESNIQYATEKISEVKELNAAKIAAAEEVARIKSRLEEAKNALKKEKKQYTAKEKENQARLKRLAQEKEAIARGLEIEKKTKSDLQEKIDDALGKYAQITQQIEANKAVLAKNLAAHVDDKLQRVEARITEESKKRAETDAQFKAQFSSIANRVNQKVEALSSESTARVTEIYTELRDAISQRPNITPGQINEMLSPIYSRLDELKDVSASQKSSIMEFILDKLNIRKKNSQNKPSQQEQASFVQTAATQPAHADKIEDIDIDQLFEEKQKWKKENGITSVEVPDINIDELLLDKYNGIRCRRS